LTTLTASVGEILQGSYAAFQRLHDALVAGGGLLRLSRLLLLDAGYKNEGKDWAEKVSGLSAEIVRPPRR
jgi:hypothetical protein